MVLAGALATLDDYFDTRKVRSVVRYRLGDLYSALSPSSDGIEFPGDVKRVCLHHLRKTGGTSLAFAFYSLSGTDAKAVEKMVSRFTFAKVGGYRFVAHNEKLISGGKFTFASSHKPMYVTNPPSVGTFGVTILRDPVQRLVSLYRYLSDTRSDDGFAHRARDEQRAWAVDGYHGFLDQIPNFHLMNQLYSFSREGNVDEAVEAASSLHMILRTESLDQGCLELSARLGVPLELSRFRESTLPIELTQDEVDRTRELIEPEARFVEKVGLL